MKKLKIVLLIALAWVAIRVYLSFAMASSDISQITTFLVMFGPIAPLILAAYAHIKDKQGVFSFASLFKQSVKAGFVFALIYLLGLLLLFNYINPTDFSARKALIIAKEVQASAGAENAPSPEKLRDNMNQVFTPFNYASITFLLLVLLSLFYSVVLSFIALYFQNKVKKSASGKL